MTQQEALAIMDSGASVLLTGAAGTGKTHTLNVFIRHARASGKLVSVTATTGLAATHLNGNTIHSWAGIGIKHQVHPDMLKKMPDSRKKIIKNTDILIIDEISMLHDYRLEMIDTVCKHVRQNDAPFGGLQVILCGDFYQLPPVNRADEPHGGFITQSSLWHDGIFSVCYLVEQYRQKDDQVYTDILNGIRAGVLNRSQLTKLLDKQNTTLDATLAVTKLLTTNVDTDSINQQHLATLNTKAATYEMLLTGSKKYKEQLLKSCLAMPTLTLKINAQVMCIKNSPDKKYVNGSLGVVVGFEDTTNYPIVALNSGKKIVIKPESWELIDGDKIRATATQIPLRLAWAITVHKSQGMTLDAATIDLSKAFVEGMGYVALSRVKSIDTLSLLGINGMALKVSPVAKQLDEELRLKSKQAIQEHQHHINEWGKTKPLKTEILTKKQQGSWADKLAKMRITHPNAYKPWSEADDKKLVTQFSDGLSIPQLSKALGRHEGSIKIRLQKHLGEDIFDA